LITGSWTLGGGKSPMDWTECTFPQGLFHLGRLLRRMEPEPLTTLTEIATFRLSVPAVASCFQDLAWFGTTGQQVSHPERWRRESHQFAP